MNSLVVTHADNLDLNDLPVFLAVVETGGFTAAANRLGCAKARVSLVIKRLEQRLGTTLLTRTTRRVRLTASGEQLYQSCRPLLEGLGQALGDVETPAVSLAGELRVSAPDDYAERVLAPLVLAFKQQHPRLRIELRSEDRISDLVDEGIDLAIRIGWPQDSTLRASRLGCFEQYLVAAPEYLQKQGQPHHPDDLASHAWIAFSPLSAPLTWTFRRDGETRCIQMRAAFTANATGVLRSLVLNGAGLSVLTNMAVQTELDACRLVRVLSEWQLDAGGIYAVYPPGRYLSAGAHRFVDFLRHEISHSRT